ncbi:unnamed protein product [Cochlearia groenlandica]
MLRLLQISFLLCFLLAAEISISPATATISDNESIYEILQANGLPIGIFPKGVKDFDFNAQTGKFSVYLNQSCEAKYETELRFAENITGKIGSAQISDLSGINAHDLFLWFPVKGIRVDVPSSGLIYFDVGVIFKQYSLSVFDTPRDCVPFHEVKSSMVSLHQVDEILGRNII